MKKNSYYRKFLSRHIAIDDVEKAKMLNTIGYKNLNALIDDTVPKSIRSKKELNLPASLHESAFIEDFNKIASKNKVFKNYIGQGFHPSHLPAVIQRNVLENPGWYTSYTPYQAEISQGRLEALINFQTMVSDLTGLSIANASLLDESTAIAEAMAMMYNAREKEKKESTYIFIDEHIFPQNLAVVKTRAEPLGINIETGAWSHFQGKDRSKYFALVVQFPNINGTIEEDYIKKIKEWQKQGVKIIVAADIMSLTIYTPPGDYDADVAVGTTQRLGIPMGYGGPSAAYFACQEKYKRRIPGRIIGASKDKHDNIAYRMALQTREQHIKREKATSNICTAQALLASMAGLYAVYHGPEGMLRIGKRIHLYTELLRAGLIKLGYNVMKGIVFDTITVVDRLEVIANINTRALAKKVNLKYVADKISISLNETTTDADVNELLHIFDVKGKGNVCLKSLSLEEQSNLEIPSSINPSINPSIIRTTPYLQHSVFKKYHSEHEMLRYLKQLENKDISLVHSMIPLGSCTMKLNATTEMMPLSWASWSNIHPYAPLNQVQGYHYVIKHLGKWLTDITGFASISFQPNSGAQGEYAGLWLIDKYHKSKQDNNRDVVFIPQSAHGTNPASAVMCGKKVVIIKCLDKGEIDIQDLKDKIKEYSSRLCALMVTYPSTRGVFDSNIKEVCKHVHDAGGQVYMDGANMNAQIGLTSPAIIGADVCHLNLHKTFSIPHGGGGPGMGPICCAKHLAPLLPEAGSKAKSGFDEKQIQWASTVYGSASILAISYAYIAMMGVTGMKTATEIAILNANYIKARLKKYYDVLFVGEKGCVAHELIVDCRPFRDKNILVEDIAKRLIDYGFHAPTVSFPVVGALMVEPTESESKEELDRFCDAMVSIRKEIDSIDIGNDNNLLKNAPHTAEDIICGAWDYPYSREQAAYPLPYLRDNKYWPPISRIDNAYGDRNLFCTCPVIDIEE